MFRVLFDRAGIVGIRSIQPGVSLVIVAFWRLFVVVCSPRNFSIEFAWCDGPTALQRRASRRRQEPRA